MEPGANDEQIQATVQRVEDLGLKANVIVGTERTVVAAIGEKREHFKESLESGRTRTHPISHAAIVVVAKDRSCIVLPRRMHAVAMAPIMIGLMAFDSISAATVPKA